MATEDLIDSKSLCECDNCAWEGTYKEVDIPALVDFDRLEPGHEVPAGECPECGSFAYWVRNDNAIAA